MARYKFYHIMRKISDYNYSNSRYYHPNCMTMNFGFDKMSEFDYSSDGFYEVCDNDYYKLNNIRLRFGEERIKKSIHNWHRKDDCIGDLFY